MGIATLHPSYELEARCAALEVALEESFADNLYNGVHTGVVNGKGLWWSSGMSDAEWAERELNPEGLKLSFQQMLERVPAQAKEMVRRAALADNGRKENG